MLVRASGEGRMSAGEVRVEARAKVDVCKDEVEARIRKDNHAQFDDQDADEDEDAESNSSKPCQHHQKYNSTSSTSSCASSSVSVLTGTTGVAGQTATNTTRRRTTSVGASTDGA